MSPLQSPQVQALLDAIDRLYMPVSAAEFPRHLIEVIGALVPATMTTFDIIHKDPEKCVNVQGRPVSEQWQNRCAELLPTHPTVVYVNNGGTESVVKITDVITQRQFRKTALYNELFRTADAEYQIAALVPIEGGVAGLAINRDIDFVEEERVMLQYLRPHIARAHALSDMYAAANACPVPVGDCRPWAKKRGLTPREMEILHWIAEGKRDKEIAEILGLSWRTVKTHAVRIFQKLGVETRTAAAAEWRSAQG